MLATISENDSNSYQILKLIPFEVLIFFILTSYLVSFLLTPTSLKSQLVSMTKFILWLFKQPQKIQKNSETKSFLFPLTVLMLCFVQFFISDNLVSQATYKDKTWIRSFEELEIRKDVTPVMMPNVLYGFSNFPEMKKVFQNREIIRYGSFTKVVRKTNIFKYLMDPKYVVVGDYLQMERLLLSHQQLPLVISDKRIYSIGTKFAVYNYTGSNLAGKLVKRYLINLIKNLLNN